MADKNDIQEIKARLDIVTVVSQYVQLKKAGRTWSGLCPFHREKTPSFHVNPQLGIYKCFGCGKTGDMFTFIQEIEHINFPDALEKLAKQAGVILTQQGDNAQYKAISRLKQLSKDAAEFYNYLLTKHTLGKAAYEYALTKRKLTEETIAVYLIGFAPKNGKLLQGYLQKKGYSLQEIADAGLLNDHGYDKFTNRLMFSLFDSSGTIIGFSGRVFENDDDRPKYLNSPETPIFKKRYNLFGYYQAKDEIAKKDLAILCEGQIDAISSQQSGVKNIVAPLGTGLTDSQLGLISRLTKNIAFCFDNDAAGQKSTIRGVEMALSLGLRPFVLTLPQGVKDIDELVNQIPGEWESIASKPLDYFDIKIAELEKIIKTDFDLFEQKLTELLSTISFAPDLKKNILIKEIASRIGLEETTLLEAVSEKKQVSLKQEGIQQRQGALTTVEYLLSLILDFPLLALVTGAPESVSRFLLTDVHKKLYTLLYSFAIPYKDIIVNKKGVDKSGRNWSMLFTEFQTAAGVEYARYLRQIQEETDVKEVIFRLGINNEYTGREIADEVVKDFYSTFKRLKKSVIFMELQVLQEKIQKAELQKDKVMIKELTKQIQSCREDLIQIETLKV